MNRLTLLAAALCTLMTSCGGGDAEALARDQQAHTRFGMVDSAGATPAAGEPHRRVLSSSSTYSEDLASQLFALAESSYAAYFPSPQPTHSFEYWAYRYYPQTGTYLAVIGSGVYVLGGVFGPEVVYVGEAQTLLGQTPPVTTQRLTASQLGLCPDASGSTSQSFYNCMVGFAEGTQTFDASKSCRLEITAQGVLTLSTAGQSITVGPQFGLAVYSKIASPAFMNVRVKAGTGAYVAGITLATAQGFDFSDGGTLSAEGTPQGSTTATVSCRLNIAK